VTKSQSAVTSSGYTGSRLGVRGTEDLGGGLAANFWLEAGFNTDTGIGAGSGGLSFNRRSTVSLSGVYGEVRLGRDYTPTFFNDNIFDPFLTNGVGTNLIATANGGTAFGVPNSGFQLNPNYVRASNSVSYFLPPNLGGFYGQVMYAFNEKTSYDPGSLTPPGAAAIVANPALAATADNARVGRYVGARVGYANGPLDIALAYGESTIGSNYYFGSTTTLDIWNLGASYDFGAAKLFGEYSNNKQVTKLAVNAFNPFGITKPGANGGLIGVTVPIGASLIRVSYAEVRYNNLPPSIFAKQPKADQFALGYVYNLSKRTALYATASYLSNKDGAALAVTGSPTFYLGTVPGSIGNAVPNTSKGYDLGIRHAF
jgi:predicted porin